MTTTRVDEAVVTITHTVSSTDDSEYDGLTAAGVAVTVTDDDSVGVTVSKTALEIEEGASDTYTVALDTEPAGEVKVDHRRRRGHGRIAGQDHPDLHRPGLGHGPDGNGNGGA